MPENPRPTTETAAVTTESAADARPARAGTVVWGVILVALAAMFFATAQLDLDEVSGWVVLAWGILALGAALVIGGLITTVIRHRP